MAVELPPREAIEGEIILLNQELLVLGSKAEIQGLKPVKYTRLSVVEDRHSEPAETTTAAAFWNHHIGGPLAAVDVQMYFLKESGRADEEVVSTTQESLYRLATAWAKHPVVRNDPLNRASNEAFLKGGFSFDWMKAPSLTRKLKDHITDIADFYSLREGHLPLSFVGIQEGKSSPTRAYLLYSNP